MTAPRPVGAPLTLLRGESVTDAARREIAAISAELADIRAGNTEYAHERNREATLAQTEDALAALDRDARTFVRWTWPAMDRLTGGMAPGTVQIPAAFSGGGKTTFISSQVNGWIDGDVPVAVLPLETEPHTFRTYLACHRLSAQGVALSPGEVFTGNAQRRRDWPVLRAALVDELRRQRKEEAGRLWIANGVEHVTLDALRLAVDEAAAFGARVLVIDHIDHIGTDGDTEGFAAAEQVNNAVLQLAKDYGLVIVPTSQLNLAALRKGDKLAKYQPPGVDHLFMGMSKIKNASTIVGLYRPVRRPHPGEHVDAYQDALKSARSGEGEPYHALEPDVMGVVVMKSRAAGARVVDEDGTERGRIHDGARALLRVTHGRVESLPDADRLMYEQSMHAIASQLAARTLRRGGRG